MFWILRLRRNVVGGRIALAIVLALRRGLGSVLFGGRALLQFLVSGRRSGFDVRSARRLATFGGFLIVHT